MKTFKIELSRITSLSPSTDLNMNLSAPESAVDVDDSCDSSSDIVKADYVEGTNYDSQMGSGSESQVDFGECIGKSYLTLDKIKLMHRN